MLVNAHLLVSSTLSVDLERTYSEQLRQPMHMLHTNQHIPWYVDLTLHLSQTLGSINTGFVPTMTTMLTIWKMKTSCCHGNQLMPAPLM